MRREEEKKEGRKGRRKGSMREGMAKRREIERVNEYGYIDGMYLLPQTLQACSLTLPQRSCCHMHVLTAVVAVCAARGEWKPSAVAELPTAVLTPRGCPPTMIIIIFIKKSLI